MIISYNYTQSKWYGGMMYSEPVNRPSGTQNLVTVSDSLPVFNESNAYRFTIEPGKIHYLGTWNFSETIPSFSNNKDSVTAVVQKKFKKIDFSTALLSLPE